MAPTGRAARRMVESTGCENASTMHLAWGFWEMIRILNRILSTCLPDF